MKTLVFGFGDNIERQYANCTIYAMKNGLDIVGNYDNMPQAIENIRNVKMVLLDKSIRAEYNDKELKILTETFARYGAETGIVE